MDLVIHASLGQSSRATMKTCVTTHCMSPSNAQTEGHFRTGHFQTGKMWTLKGPSPNGGVALTEQAAPTQRHLVYAMTSWCWNPRGCHLPSEQAQTLFFCLHHWLQVAFFSLKKNFFGKGYCPEFFQWFGFLAFLEGFFFSLIVCSSNNGVIYGLQANSCHGSHTELCFLNRWLLSLWPDTAVLLWGRVMWPLRAPEPWSCSVG